MTTTAPKTARRLGRPPSKAKKNHSIIEYRRNRVGKRNKRDRRRGKAIPRGSSNAGRPRLEGDRYPSGRLKPPAPNARVLADRAAVMGDGGGDLTKASNPMDLALERGWLTIAHHRAGMVYASLYVATSSGAPRAGSSNYGEVDTIGSYFGESLADMTPAEIAAAFDKAFAKASPAPGDNHAEAAMLKWRLINGSMSPAQQTEVFRVCVMESWPQWVIQRAAGHMETGWERGRTALVAGLEAIVCVLRPPKPATPSLESAPAPTAKTSGSKLAERTEYVDAAGNLLYEAVTLRRRT